MAANIMTEILKLIQRDLQNVQKNINEKFSNFDSKISDLDKKIDQQQVTIGKLEQQVKNNNVLLFGNDDNETIFEGETIVPGKLNFYDEHKKGSDQIRKSLENTEADQQSDFKLTGMYNVTEASCDKKTDVDKDKIMEFMTSQMQDMKTLITLIRDSIDENAYPVPKQVTACEKLITNELREMKESITSIKNSVAERKTSIQEDTILIRKQMTEFEEFTTNELREMKGLITSVKDSVAARNTSIQEVNIPIRKQMTEFEKFTTNELQEVKDLITSITDSEAERKTPIKKSARPVRKQETVKISPTYFSADQISKLNRELKRITEMHQSSDIFPIIEVIPRPCDEHPVMKRLRDGVLYKKKNGAYGNYPIKLGTRGWNTSDIQDKLTDYPDLLLYDIVKETLILKNKWSESCIKYNFANPLPYYNVQ